MTSNQLKLLEEYLIDTGIRLILHLMIWAAGFVIAFAFHTDVFPLRYSLTAICARIIIPAVFIIIGLPELLRLLRLFFCILCDLSSKKTASGNLSGLNIVRSSRFVLSKQKSYAIIGKLHDFMIFNEPPKGAQRKQKKPDQSGAKRILTKIRQSVMVFAQLIANLYGLVGRSVLIDHRICDKEKLQGLMQTAEHGKSFPYIASRYAGIVFEFYPERTPEKVWSMKEIQWNG